MGTMHTRLFHVSLVLLALILAPATIIGLAHAEKKQWTILVYMAADNDLEPAGLKDLAELEVYGSSSSVNIIVLIDRSDRPYEQQYYTEFARVLGDWSDARVYYVVRDGYTLSYSSELLEELGEVNTGDPETLKNFIVKYASRYPAEHYMLVIWDHGNHLGQVAFDVDSRDYLSLKEIREAIEGSGLHLDVLAFDACLMGSYETLYELRGLADYIVASEEIVPGDGYPYDKIMQMLAENPNIFPRELATGIVKAYGDYYTRVQDDPTITLAAIDMKKFETTIGLAKSFAEAAAKNPQALARARNGIEAFGGGNDPSRGAATVDFIQLAKRLEEDPQLGDLASRLAESLESAVIVKVSGREHSGAQGISIYFPMRYDASSYLEASSWARETDWVNAVSQAVNVNADIDGLEETEVAYQAPITDVVPGASETSTQESYFYAMMGGFLDIDKNGDNEILVAPVTIDENYRMIEGLAVYDYKDNRMVKVFSKAVIQTSGEEFLGPAGSTALFDHGYEAEAVLASIILEETTEGTNYTTKLVRVYSDSQGYHTATLTLHSFYLSSLDRIDIDHDGRDELFVSGVRIGEGKAYNSILVLDVATAKKIVEAEMEAQDYYTSVAYYVSAATIVPLDRGYGVAIALVEVNLDTREPQATRIQLLQITSKGVRPLSYVDAENIVVDTLANYTINGRPVVLALAEPAEGGSKAYLIILGYDTQSIKPLKLYSIDIGEGLTLTGMDVFDIDGDGIYEILVGQGEIVDEEYGIMIPRQADAYSITPRGLKYETRININPESESEVIPVPCDINGDRVIDMVYIVRNLANIEIRIGKVSNYVNPMGTIEGRVLDKNGQPVQGIQVIAKIPRGENIAGQAITDNEGEFSIKVPAGSYVIEASSSSGDLYASKEVRVRPNETLTVELVVKPRSEQTQLQQWVVTIGGGGESQTQTTTTTTTTATTLTTTTTTTTTSQAATTSPTTTTIVAVAPTTTTLTTTITVTSTHQPQTTTTGTQSTTTQASPQPSPSTVTVTVVTGQQQASQPESTRPGGGTLTMYRASMVAVAVVLVALIYIARRHRG